MTTRSAFRAAHAHDFDRHCSVFGGASAPAAQCAGRSRSEHMGSPRSGGSASHVLGFHPGFEHALAPHAPGVLGAVIPVSASHVGRSLSTPSSGIGDDELRRSASFHVHFSSPLPLAQNGVFFCSGLRYHQTFFLRRISHSIEPFLPRGSLSRVRSLFFITGGAQLAYPADGIRSDFFAAGIRGHSFGFGGVAGDGCGRRWEGPMGAKTLITSWRRVPPERAAKPVALKEDPIDAEAGRPPVLQKGTNHEVKDEWLADESSNTRPPKVASYPAGHVRAARNRGRKFSKAALLCASAAPSESP